MLYEKLNQCFQTNEALSEKFDLNTYFKYLTRYIAAETKEGNKMLIPSRFAKVNEIDEESANLFFLGLAFVGDGFITMNFLYECKNCQNKNVFLHDSTHDNLTCIHCHADRKSESITISDLFVEFQFSKSMQERIEQSTY